MFAGGVGSFVSRSFDNESTPIAATAGRSLHYIEATLRWFIGLTAGLIVWLFDRDFEQSLGIPDKWH